MQEPVHSESGKEIPLHVNINAQAEDVGTKPEKSRCKKNYNQQDQQGTKKT